MSTQDANSMKLGQSASHNNNIYMVNYSCFNVLVPDSLILIQFLFCKHREEKFLFYFEVAAQIVYLLILIVVLVFALHKRSSNNSSCDGRQ